MSPAHIIRWPANALMTTDHSVVELEPTDPREVPIYSVAEAALYLGIRQNTLRSWTRGRDYKLRDGSLRHFNPLLTPADIDSGRLSFANLAEAHVLLATRDKGIPIPDVRDGIDYVLEKWPSLHPLISQEFYHKGRELFVKRIEEGQTINLSKGGQLTLREVLDQYLERLERDETGYPIRIFPMNTTRLVMDVGIASGQPTIQGTRIMASILWSRRLAGDSSADLAGEYGLSQADVDEAIRHFEAA